jgi:pimeloyl-ACP methyl ester carboxylesterase
MLLPGLDGTGDLFARFISEAPMGFPVQALRLPSDRPRSYQQLADSLIARLPTAPFALIAESFSGPLAILVANRCPRVTAVVLCASFVQPPLPRLLAKVPELVWRLAPPAAILSLLLTGGDRPLARAVERAVAGVDRHVIAGRIVAALTIDVGSELERLSQPLLCLRATRDRLLPTSCTVNIRARKSSALFAEVDGPHLLLQANPTGAWRQIQPFLEQVSLRGAGGLSRIEQ